VHRLSEAPAPAEGWGDRVGLLARELREEGARWVVAILHDGVDRWPNLEPDGPPTRARAERLAKLLERDLVTELVATGARPALLRALERVA
jgi:hypothetical protein